MVSPDSEGEVIGIEKHEVEESEKENMATSFEGGNNEDGVAAAPPAEAVKKELTVNLKAVQLMDCKLCVLHILLFFTTLKSYKMILS